MTVIPAQDVIRSLGTIMSVWAHPDDESFTCAGLMSMAAQNGQTVVCLTATKGEKGTKDPGRWPPEKLAAIRTEELEAALRVLGVPNHHWLGYVDGECKDVDPQEAVEKIKKFIQQYQPDTIFTFGPEGYTGHDDHCTVSKWVSMAVKGSDITVYHVVQLRETYEKMLAADDKFNIFFNIDQPPLKDETECDLVYHLPDDVMDKKYRCLCAQASQTEAMFASMGEEAICNMLCCEAFVKAK